MYLQNNENLADEDEFDGIADFTRSTWSFLIKRNGVPAAQEIIAVIQEATATDRAPLIRLNTDGTILFYWEDLGGAAGKSIATTSNCCDNAWHLITFTYDGDNECKAYFDDTLEGTVDISTRTTDDSPWARSDKFNFGNYANNGANPASFLLGDFIVWERVLTQSAITALNNSGSFLTQAAIAATAKTYATDEWTDTGEVSWPSISQPDDRLVRWQEGSVSEFWPNRDSRGPWGGAFAAGSTAEGLCLRWDIFSEMMYRTWRVEFDLTELVMVGTSLDFMFVRTNTAVTDEASLVTATSSLVGATLSNLTGGTDATNIFRMTAPGRKSVDFDLINPSTNTSAYIAFRNVGGTMAFAFDDFRLTEVTPLKDNAITGLATINGDNWVKQDGSPTFYESGANGFRIGSNSSATSDHWLNEDIRATMGGSLSGKTLRVTFNYETTTAGVVSCGFVDGAAPAFAPGATGHGNITNPVGCTVAGGAGNQRVDLDNTGSGATACSFDVTDLENGNDVWFQFDGGITGRVIITDFQITDIT
jgi:hypothetical protein